MQNNILITGGNRGIGLGLVLEYAKKTSTRKIIILARNIDDLKETKALVEAEGKQCDIYSVDVQDEQLMKNTIDIIESKDQVDIVIANAGAATKECWASFNDLDTQAKCMFNVNVYGVFNTIHPVLHYMFKRKKGRVVVISSMLGLLQVPGNIAYCASKAGLQRYCESLQYVVKRHNINLHIVLPGSVYTDITKYNQFEVRGSKSIQESAQIIIKGIKKNRSIIAYPLHLYILIHIFNMMPYFIRSYLSRFLPKRHGQYDGLSS